MSKETKYIVETGYPGSSWSFHSQWAQKEKALDHYESISDPELSKRVIEVQRELVKEETSRYRTVDEAEKVIDKLEDAIREARVHANSRAKHILNDALKETGLY